MRGSQAKRLGRGERDNEKEAVSNILLHGIKREKKKKRKTEEEETEKEVRHKKQREFLPYYNASHATDTPGDKALLRVFSARLLHHVHLYHVQHLQYKLLFTTVEDQRAGLPPA